MKKIYLYLSLLAIFCFLVTLPFFRQGFFTTHDGEWAVVRLGAMERSFIARQIPARWQGELNFGYGYPLFEFTYPLPYYLGEVLNNVGFGLINSIKALFVLSVFGSVFAMFWLSKKIFGEDGAFISSAFYTFASYRLVNLYIRGSIGESLSLMLFPVLFFLAIKIAKELSLRYTALFSISFAMLILTHNVTALVFAPFLLAFFLMQIFFNKRNRKNLIFHCILGFGLGFLISSFFLLPALVEKKFIALSHIPIADLGKNFVNLYQLVYSPWNTGAFGTANSFSPQIGIFTFLALLLSVIVFYLYKTNKKIYVFSIISVLTLIFFMLPVSLLLWKNLPLFSNVDFPWRLLTPLIFFTSISLGLLGQKRKIFYISLLLLAGLIFVNLSHANPENYNNYPEDYYLTNQATTTSNDELMPVWVKNKPTQRPNSKIENLNGNEEIQLVSMSETKVNFKIVNADPRTLQFNTIFFPGWEAFVNNVRAPISYKNDSGVMRISVDKGTNNVTFKFSETPLRKLADLLSILGIIGVVLLLWKPKLKKLS